MSKGSEQVEVEREGFGLWRWRWWHGNCVKSLGDAPMLKGSALTRDRAVKAADKAIHRYFKQAESRSMVDLP